MDRWLNLQGCSHPTRAAATSAVIFWMIWKTQNDAVFKGVQPNLEIIPCRATEHINEYINRTKYKMWKFLLKLDFHSCMGFLLFTDAAWSCVNMVGGMGFIVLSNDKRILLIGCQQVWDLSGMEAEAKAIEWALQRVIEACIKICGMFTDYAEVIQAVEDIEEQSNWQITPTISNIRLLLNQVEFLKAEWIARD